MEERVQKIIAASGRASRREAEKLIRAGRVAINGETLTALGAKADPVRDRVTVDGERVGVPGRLHYLVLNKPLHCLTTLSDEAGRFCVGDLLRKIDVRLYPAGRLDWDSEGLLVLTNDGDFADRIMHPRYEVPKTYLAKVEGKVSSRALSRLRRGVILDDGPTLPAKVELAREGTRNDWLRITLTEGRNRIVRRMCERVRHRVIKLKRIGVGPLRLGSLRPSQWRPFGPDELAFVAALKEGRTPPEAHATRAKKPPRGPGFARAKPSRVRPSYKKKKRAAKGARPSSRGRR